MIVRANKSQEYVFLPSYGELQLFRNKYGNLCRSRGDGFSLLAYELLPSALIKGKVYNFEGYVFISKHTAEFSTGSLLLGSLGLTVAVDNGAVLDASEGLISVANNVLDYDENGFILKGMPQLYGIYRLNGGDEVVIKGINGNYDFKTDLFHGVLDVQSYDLFLELEAL